MNKNLKKLTGIVTTGALVLTLGTGAMMISNTTAYAAATDAGVQVEEGRVAGRGGQNQRALGMEAGIRAEKAERVEGMEAGVRAEKAGREQGIKEKQDLDFTTLVDAGLLSETQVAAINVFSEEKVAEREANKVLVEAMTKEERQAYFQEKKAEEKPRLFDLLVEEGILETSEAEAITTFIQEQRSIEKASMMTTKLEPLVTDGTLTSADVVAVIDYLNDLEPRVKPVKGELLADDEALERISPFDEMASKSIITETQADAIEALLKTAQRARR